MSAKKIIVICIICIISVILFLSFNSYSAREKRYYTDTDNYITSTGIIKNITYNEDRSMLYLSMDQIDPQYADICFKIIPENLNIARNRGIDENIRVGDTVTFVSAPRYFGDGYIMPLLAISKDNTEFLSFEEGYPNFIRWLKTGNKSILIDKNKEHRMTH